MYKIDDINVFFDKSVTYAMVGVSKNKQKFGNTAFKHLKSQGYKVFPVNNTMSELDGEKVYSSVTDLPEDVKHVIIMTPQKVSKQIIEESLKKGITHIWLQQSAGDEETIEFGKKSGITFVYGRCMFMFAQPVKGMHKFHRSILEFFGKVPRVVRN